MNALLATCLLVTVGCAEAPKATLLAFQASWCQPCHRMEPVLEQLEAKGYKIKRIDIDEQPQLAAKYGVTAVPTYIAIVDGHEVGRETGVRPLKVLLKLLRLKSKITSLSD